MNAPLDRSRRIRRSAVKLLDQTSLLTRLSAYGTVEATGSYEYDLMIEPDIDLIVRSESVRASAVGACREFLAKTEFSRVEFGDFISFPRPNRPVGCILVLRLPVRGVLWEIEIWFVEPSYDANSSLKEELAGISEQQRESILRIKQERAANGINKHQLSSTDIYEGVIRKNLSSLSQFTKKA